VCFLELKLYFYIFRFKSSEIKAHCVESRQTSANPNLQFIPYRFGIVRTLDVEDENVGQKECNKFYSNVIRLVGRRHYIIEVQTALALDSAILLLEVVLEDQ
jgi:hypothetical protein